ncbi:MAG TPA: nuclear transport factor 2 family protein [Bryobacteraceae bacterium]|nr:nuclear transport factor 2 family protein [Bryobacteraceae bacterium]
MVSLALFLLMAASSADSMRDEIVASERAELDCLKTGDMKTFAGLIADEAVFVDSRGADGKQPVVEHSAAVHLDEFSMDDIRFVQVSPDSGLIAYTLTEKGSAHGHEFSARVHVSALWTKRGGRWVCLFSQETPAREAKPAPLQ